jgi:chemotaxis regulatin CheY-phosphate phosphatase CheZ
MTDEARSLTPIADADYAAIEQAVMETARGRWFLREYAARNRQADTNQLLDAIGKLERAVSGEHASQHIERVRYDLLEMAKSISRLKVEVDAVKPESGETTQFDQAANALDTIVRTTERATSSILEAAESIQEAAWSLRESNADEASCDVIDRLATEIYTACSFQDITAQQTQKVVRTLRFLEGRINALIDAWSGKDGQDPASGPADASSAAASGHDRASRPADLSQDDVDFVLVADRASAAPAAALPVDDIPPNVALSLEMAETITDMDALAAELAVGPDTDLMVADDDPVVIDDADPTDVVLTGGRADEEFSADMAWPAPPAASGKPSRSLSEIDALPTTEKALIFG